MTGEELIEEAKRLARPCVYLTGQQSDNQEVAGVWGDPGLVPAPSEEYRHWLTVDCRFLPEGFSDLPAGCMSIYVDEEEEGGLVALNPSLHLSAPVGDGVSLYAHPGVSLPDLDAVFQLGSPAVKEWLAANGWQPDWGYNGNFKDQATVGAYFDYRETRNPLTTGAEEFLGGTYAMLGGWHEPWPDSEPEDSLGKRLVVMTYWDAEPFIEVWVDAKQQFRVIPRIT